MIRRRRKRAAVTNARRVPDQSPPASPFLHTSRVSSHAWDSGRGHPVRRIAFSTIRENPPQGFGKRNGVSGKRRIAVAWRWRIGVSRGGTGITVVARQSRTRGHDPAAFRAGPKGADRSRPHRGLARAVAAKQMHDAEDAARPLRGGKPPSPKNRLRVHGGNRVGSVERGYRRTRPLSVLRLGGRRVSASGGVDRPYRGQLSGRCVLPPLRAPRAGDHRRFRRAAADGSRRRSRLEGPVPSGNLGYRTAGPSRDGRAGHERLRAHRPPRRSPVGRRRGRRTGRAGRAHRLGVDGRASLPRGSRGRLRTCPRPPARAPRRAKARGETNATAVATPPRRRPRPYRAPLSRRA